MFVNYFSHINSNFTSKALGSQFIFLCKGYLLCLSGFDRKGVFFFRCIINFPILCVNLKESMCKKTIYSLFQIPYIENGLNRIDLTLFTLFVCFVWSKQVL